MQKLITFAVPCYNSSAYMKKCVDSLLLAGENAEIILVDDGSFKDNTAEIVDEYAKKYPSIIKAVHQENGGHGEAVNTGLKNATGLFYKVVDSDDWVDAESLNKLMQTVKGFSENELPDAIFVNYVYEYTLNDTQRVVKYKNVFPKEKFFTFEDTKKFSLGQYITMHSLIHRTQVLRDCGLTLPKHTFYVDNVLIYQPLPYLKKLYYLDIDFYRYYIGREDQSVNEQVIINRIDQHIRVTEIIINAYNLNEIKKQSKKLYRYMLEHLNILMVICSIYLIKINTEESFEKKKKLWELLKEKDGATYKKCKNRFTGMSASGSEMICGMCKFVYSVARKIFKFN